MPDIQSSLIDLAGQTIKVFVPAIGIVEGVVQTAQGDPLGPIKVFVPGVGIIEAAGRGASDVWSMVEGGAVGVVTKNAAAAVAPWLLIGGAILLGVVLFSGKR